MDKASGVPSTKRDKPTMKEVAACFHLPIELAAKKLGVGQTWLKLLCRANGVSRWPFRKIQSLHNSLDRSKKLQGLVEVAQVINKNLPQWLDIDGEVPQVNISHGLSGCPVNSCEENSGTNQTSITGASEHASDLENNNPKQDGQFGNSYVCSPTTSSAADLKIPKKRETRFDLGIRHLSEDGTISNSAAAAGDKRDETSQWERILHEAACSQSFPQRKALSSFEGAFRSFPQAQGQAQLFFSGAPFGFDLDTSFLRNPSAFPGMPIATAPFSPLFATAFAHPGAFGIPSGQVLQEMLTSLSKANHAQDQAISSGRNYD
uniref:RWP-RK domain-containing protein n=1 Tax=Tetraselmis sp. GSL018 TaxID=582737 RepID=A0A061RHW5_9CHLO|mmetsp:Transcript_41385/g.98115  ORF Transcript_41385/g.98115 Transcript_41385/m.98115 type:complete len:319 (-) Transcript_41385:186-1142(-)